MEVICTGPSPSVSIPWWNHCKNVALLSHVKVQGFVQYESKSQLACSFGNNTISVFLYDEQTRLDSVIIVIEQIIKWIWKMPKEQLSQEWKAWHKIGYVSMSFQTTFRTKNNCEKTSVYYNERIKFKSVATIRAESFFSFPSMYVMMLVSFFCNFQTQKHNNIFF